MKLTKKAKKGFTLVELIVVIAIIAILAAVSVAGYYGFIASANQSAANQEADQIKNVIRVAAIQGAEKGQIGSGDNTGTLEFTYNWTAKGLEASGVEEAANKNKTTDKNLTDLIAIVKVFGGMDLTPVELTAKNTAAATGNNKASLGFVEFGTGAEDKVIKTVTYVSAKNITSLIEFNK